MSTRPERILRRRGALSVRRVCPIAAVAVFAGIAARAPPAGAGDWLFTPSLQDQEIFTDNVLATPTNRRSDLITALSPGLAISGQSARLSGQFSYSPTLYRYALTPGQNVLAHNLYANGTATLAPDLLFFDAHAYASQQPTTPGLGSNLASFGPTAGLSAIGPTNLFTTSALPQSQLTQVTTFIGAPYVQRRFGEYGIGELRYTFADNNFSGGQNLLLPPGVSASQNSTAITNEATATFITGSYFHRFTSRVLLDTSRSTGTGALNNTRQSRAIVATEYPLVRAISALTTLGYEDLRFGGVPAVGINDAVWGIGARFAPTPDRNLIVLFGRHDGITSPYAALNYAITPLTRVTADYSDSLNTFSQDIEQNLALSNNLAGQTVDARTLLPLPIHNPLLGLQLSLLRIKRISGTGYIDYERDHLSLGVDREQDLVVAQVAPASGVSLRATTVNWGWAHDVNPVTTAQLGLGYSWITLSQVPVVNEQLFTAAASINYLFNPSLTGSASYTYINRASDQPQFKLSSNIVVVSLHKTF